MRDGQRVGLVRVFDLADPTALFDLRIASDQRGHGHGRQAVRTVSAWLFGAHAHLRRIEATTRYDNTAMRRVLDACGFVKEAHYRQAWPTQGGEHVDAVGYALLRHDWETGETTPVTPD